MQFGEAAASRADLRGFGSIAFNNVNESTVFVRLEINLLSGHRVRVVVVPGLVKDLLCERYAGAVGELVPDSKFEEPDYYVGIKQY